jgi:endonuclease/exonuclease/phosphatase family metal-dependent hydrolase
VVNPGQDKEDFSLHALKIYSKLSDAFELREHQMDYLVHEMARCPYPIILAGDFNDTPSSYVYTEITSKLDDTFVEKGNGFSITYAGRLPFLRIDYVMKSERFKTENYKRHKVDFSDHYPVSAVLTTPGN